MADITATKHNESFALLDCGTGTKMELSDHFSFFAPGYQFNPKFKYGPWDGKIKLFKAGPSLLPLGLAGDALDKFARQFGYELDKTALQSNPICSMTEEQIRDWIKSQHIESKGKEITPFWYQADSVVWALKNERGILNLPTSAGKSLIQALLCRWFSDHVEVETGDISLIIVPSINLVTQMKADFVDYTLFKSSEVHATSGKELDRIPTGTRVIVSTWQTLAKKPASWFEQFGLLLCDEAHLATGVSISKIVESKMTRTPLKFGLTGTVKKAKANVMQLVGHFGPVFKPTSTKQITQEGQATPVEITALRLQYNENDSKAIKSLKYQQEIDWLVENSRRNKILARVATNIAVNETSNVMILFNFIRHGDVIIEELKKIHPEPEKIVRVTGSTKKEVREEIRQLAEDTTGLVIVASSAIMSTGVSIKNLHAAIFAHPSKSEVRTLQSLGRILRLHKSKEYARLIDIIDDLSYKKRTGKKHWNYALRHGAERLKMYAAEKFKVQHKNIPM